MRERLEKVRLDRICRAGVVSRPALSQFLSLKMRRSEKFMGFRIVERFILKLRNSERAGRTDSSGKILTMEGSFVQYPWFKD